MQKIVNLVGLVKSCPANIYIYLLFSIYYLITKIGVDTAENEPLQVHLIFHAKKPVSLTNYAKTFVIVHGELTEEDSYGYLSRDHFPLKDFFFSSCLRSVHDDVVAALALCPTSSGYT